MLTENYKRMQIFLTVSLCFNLFFAAGLLATRHFVKKLRTPEGRVELISRRLHLSDGQKTELKSLAGQVTQQVQATRAAHESDRNELRAQILSSNPDPQKIRQAVEQSSSVVMEYRSLLVEYAPEFLKILTPEQRQRLVELRDRRRAFLNR